MSSGSIQRLGVLGGTFDPLHLGHLAIASEAASTFRLDRVLFVPAGHPWQKQEFSPAEDRYLMTCLGTSDQPHIAVSRIELDRRGPTYTVDTLRSLHSFYPEAKIFFIGGVDAIRALPTWASFESLRDLTEVIVVNRPGFDLAELDAAESWPELHILNMNPIDISSTGIRELVRSESNIDHLVPGPVAAYIRRAGLYVGVDA